MSKKIKKKEIPPEVRLRKKLKRYFRRLLLVAAAVAFYFFIIPVLIPSLASQINSQKSNLENAGAAAGAELVKVLSSALRYTDKFVAGEGEGLENNAEAIIKTAVDDLKQRVKSLPREQLNKVKREFCADLLAPPEASFSATPSGTDGEGE